MKQFLRSNLFRRLVTQFLFLYLPLSNTALLAEEDNFLDIGLFGIESNYFFTKDDYEYLEASFSYRNHLREMYWPYEEEESDDMDWGVNASARKGSLLKSSDFNALEFNAFLGKRLSSGSYLEGGIGVHGVRGNGIIKDDTIPTYWANALLVVTETFDVGIDASYDYLYPEGFDTGSLSDALTGHKVIINLSWNPVSKVSIVSESAVNFISDSNKIYWTDLAVLYGISSDWPWIWAGVGAYYQKFEFESDDYWSPPEYITFGPRLDSSFPINTRLSGWVDIEINIIKESESFRSGSFAEVGGDASVGLDVSLTENTHILLGLSRYDSLRGGEHYYENSIFLSLNWPVP